MSDPATDNGAATTGGDQPLTTSRPSSPNSSQETLTLRALVGTKEAGIIIGKAGKNVADLREQTGVKAGVSKVVTGVHERVLSVSGSVQGVAKAYTNILQQLVTSSPTSPTAPSTPSNHTIIRLLISHNLMGTIIGRNGLKIKNIQDASGARMVAQKDMLPQSTERIVEVQGSPEAIGKAIAEIGKCLLEDWERGLGTQLRTQSISIPSDMVGCIIGRAGAKITEIRRLSGSKISIAKGPHDETGERMFTIVGTPESNEKALYLLYNQLESEKERRVGRELAQSSDAVA
ncbi:RNA binding protein, heterogenous nuclear RNP-K like protein [Serendipita sp. 411]|nr:RNA binding protein, heterogenous nuclear RNP-K like protein [Serendipita sp. 411]